MLPHIILNHEKENKTEGRGYANTVENREFSVKTQNSENANSEL
jgi:hypothetical protein